VTSLAFLTSHFFLEILTIQYVPFSASRWDISGKRLDFLPDYLVELIFPFEKFMQDAFGFRKHPAFVREFGQIVAFESANDQMGQM
jgi:hypothetical protein